MAADSAEVRARAAYALRHIHTDTAKHALLQAVVSDTQSVLRTALSTLRGFKMGPQDVSRLTDAVTTGQVGAASGDLVLDLLANTPNAAAAKRAALLALLNARDVLRGTKARARVILAELPGG